MFKSDKKYEDGINLSGEKVLSFRDAARFVGKRQGKKKVAMQTLWRWSTKGCGGVVLETIRIGGSRCTSEEALQRFCDRLTEAKSTDVDEPDGSAQIRESAARPPLGDVDDVLRRSGIEGGDPEGEL